MRTLLVDNYDSYTYNLFHLLASVTGEEPIVVHNDVISWRALQRSEFDAIVLSPGPGRPERWHDFGVCSDILRSSHIPVLGVCLGHQGLGHMLDGKVRSAPTVMHGRLSKVRHAGDGLFAGIPQNFSVVRYHSLTVSGSLGEDGRVIAWTEDGVVMGIEHTRRPLWGVQFHPESIATEHGHKLIENFYELAATRIRSRRRSTPTIQSDDPRHRDETRSIPMTKLAKRVIEAEVPTEGLFERLFCFCKYAFWLDSADAPTHLAQRSYLGTSAGRERRVLKYDVQGKTVTVCSGEKITVEHGSIFEVIDRELAEHPVEVPVDLPPGLSGGFVGYLGYECKADCGSTNSHRSDIPDAVMLFANRTIVVDHFACRTYLLALWEEDQAEAEQWLEEAELVARELLAAIPAKPLPPPEPVDVDPDELVVFRCGRGREQYLADIARCQAALSAGESYEVCLTDQIHTDASPDPWLLYRGLRRSNPAPFAAYLKLDDLAVLSSSPERFLSVDNDRRVQARPIKGTAARSPDPHSDEQARGGLLSDEKTFAEHLMIVDLLRNDLGRVCELGTVRVPELMVVETYSTVHQLISTVTGVLESQHSPVQCVRACFPGGSMTGAPKLRTMEIIDEVEREARGVYSGALGYFSLDGSVDLSIVIRTIVMRPGRTTIGAGGAIVAQSDPQQEFEEILLKARAPMAAIANAVTNADRGLHLEIEPSVVTVGTP